MAAEQELLFREENKCWKCPNCEIVLNVKLTMTEYDMVCFKCSKIYIPNQTDIIYSTKWKTPKDFAWICSNCTFQNTNIYALECEFCDESKQMTANSQSETDQDRETNVYKFELLISGYCNKNYDQNVPIPIQKIIGKRYGENKYSWRYIGADKVKHIMRKYNFPDLAVGILLFGDSIYEYQCYNVHEWQLLINFDDDKCTDDFQIAVGIAEEKDNDTTTKVSIERNYALIWQGWNKQLNKSLKGQGYKMGKTTDSYHYNTKMDCQEIKNGDIIMIKVDILNDTLSFGVNDKYSKRHFKNIKYLYDNWPRLFFETSVDELEVEILKYTFWS